MANNTQIVKEDNKQGSTSKNKGGALGRRSLYAMVANRATEIVNHLFNTMNNVDVQDSVRLSAANKLIDKILPNLQSQQLEDDEGNAYRVLLDIPGVTIVKNEYNRSSTKSTNQLSAKAKKGT